MIMLEELVQCCDKKKSSLEKSEEKKETFNFYRFKISFFKLDCKNSLLETKKPTLF